MCREQPGVAGGPDVPTAGLMPRALRCAAPGTAGTGDRGRACPREVIEAEPLPAGIIDASKDQERRLGDALNVWRDLAEQISDTPALAACGHPAKADALRPVLLQCVCSRTGSDSVITNLDYMGYQGFESRMAWSLACDVPAVGATS